MTKQTFLHDKHVALGARMVDFAGWEMPVQYSSIIEEHKTVRENAGLFDVSHMGELIVQGVDALAFLNKLVPQDISKLVDKKAVYCQLPNKDGGLIDDLIIYKLEDCKYLVIANASRVDEDLNWMTRNQLGFNVEIENISHKYSLIAVQGPKACDLMMSLGENYLPPFFSIKRSELFNINLWMSRTGYTGEDGVELLVKNEFAEYLWDKLLESGEQYGIKPIGLGARDTLRLEAAMSLYGNELDENTTPVEAGLAWSIPKDKQENYNGKQVITEQLKDGGKKKLIGFRMLDKSIARHGYEVYIDGEKAGVVTSGGVSPTRGENIGLAYINLCPANIYPHDIYPPLDKFAVGSTIQIMIREKLHDAEVVKLPFTVKRNKG